MNDGTNLALDIGFQPYLFPELGDGVLVAAAQREPTTPAEMLEKLKLTLIEVIKGGRETH